MFRTKFPIIFSFCVFPYRCWEKKWRKMFLRGLWKQDLNCTVNTSIFVETRLGTQFSVSFSIVFLLYAHSLIISLSWFENEVNFMSFNERIKLAYSFCFLLVWQYEFSVSTKVPYQVLGDSIRWFTEFWLNNYCFSSPSNCEEFKIVCKILIRFLQTDKSSQFFNPGFPLMQQGDVSSHARVRMLHLLLLFYWFKWC